MVTLVPIMPHTGPDRRPPLRALGPVLPDQPSHAPELQDVCRHQRQLATQRLAGNQKVIGADNPPFGIELGAERAGGPGVLVVEREEGDGSGKEGRWLD